MDSALSACFLTLALASTAHAADLDVTVSSDGIGPVNFTLRDVHAGVLPSVELPGSDGRTMRMDLTLTDAVVEGAPAYDLAMRLTKSTPHGRKRVHEVVASPTLRFLPNEEARVFMGGERPIPGTDPVQMERLNFVEISAKIRTDVSAL